MAKLYVFGIGGTGSRVLRSLTMLLASGVKLSQDIDKVVPIIIDPDSANGDFNRTTGLIKLYHDIREQLHQPKDFFSTQIQSLSQANNGGAFSPNQLQFSIDGADTKKFKQIIGDGALSDENSALKDLLFSEDNLNADMSVGFKGNPNIGSVVLNQIVKSDPYKNFAASFSPGDKIFIVSSIFGGTGAAGFPLLLKNLREVTASVAHSQDIADSIIGAVTVLPYFNVTPSKNSAIDSSSFIDKAKSAMAYYDRAIIKNKSINSLYYIGDSPKRSYDNSEGAASQKNDAHFVELASALAIVDFCNVSANMKVKNGKASAVHFKEFGIKNDASVLSFYNLSSQTKDTIKLPLTKFQMSNKYLQLGLEKALATAWVKTISSKTDKAYFAGDEYISGLKLFFNDFEEWLSEMANNDVVFKPFRLDLEPKKAIDFITDVAPTKKGLMKNDLSFDSFTKSNNEIFANYNQNSGTDQLIAMLEESSTKIVSERFPNL